jgi:hypothetical protein
MRAMSCYSKLPSDHRDTIHDVNATTLKSRRRQFQLDPKCLTRPKKTGPPALLDEMQQVHMTGWGSIPNQALHQGGAQKAPSVHLSMIRHWHDFNQHGQEC